MMLACSFLSYLDRQVLAVLSPMILAELKLNAEKYGEIISAFSVAYMIGNPVWGAILDRIGLRRGMTVAVALWTIACGAHAVLSGFLGFAVARAVLGFGEGATFPGGLRTAMDWLPPKSQSRGLAVAYSGGSLGAIVTPLVVTPIALAYGWRAAFIVTGVAGLAWVLLWRTTVDFSAATHARQSERIILPNLFERRFWSLVASYGLAALPIGLILYLAPLYLSQVLGFTQAGLGRVLWLPPLGWEVGYFFWGWFTDKFALGNRRPVWLFFTLAAIGLPQVAIVAFRNPAVALGLMFWAMFVASGFVVVSLRTSAFAYPAEQTGLVAGIGAGSWSAINAVVLPLLGRMFDAKHYSEAFVLVGVVPVLGAMLWWALTLPDRRLLDIDATK
ncbi:MAG: MFS transporter [Candidatus Acidiferrales bacterium]|jgi:ACS family hexuronate transporter-like MFS transporter